MFERIAGGSLTLNPNISESPHILPQCITIVTNNRPMSNARYLQLKEHYDQCIHCQVRSEFFLRTVQREKQRDIDLPETERQQLQRLFHILHSIMREDIAAYMDALEEDGVVQASKMFPAFAEHLDSCQECQRSVEETRKWIKTDQG